MDGGAAFVDIFVDCGQDDVRVIQTIPVNVVQRDLCVAQSRGAHAVTQDVSCKYGAAGAHKRNFYHDNSPLFLHFSVVLLMKKVYNETGKQDRKIVSDLLSFCCIRKGREA